MGEAGMEEEAARVLAGPQEERMVMEPEVARERARSAATLVMVVIVAASEDVVPMIAAAALMDDCQHCSVPHGVPLQQHPMVRAEWSMQQQ